MKVIGIAGYARCGKDTFVGIAKNILTANRYYPLRVAFADKLKEEVDDMLKKNNFQASVYTEDSVEKSLIRPLLVWWGCQRRYETDGGLYWVNQVEKQIRDTRLEFIKKGVPEDDTIILVSDVRFPNEAKWIHEKWNGAVIHLKRYVQEWRKGGQDNSDECLVREYDKAPNEEEAKQDPLVQKMADHLVEWESKGILTSAAAIEDKYLQGVVLQALNQTKFFRFPAPVIGTLSL